MEGSQAASWDGTISHNLFHPFLPPKRCWTNIQNSDFQEKYQCHLAEIYRLYQIFTNSDFRSHGFCLSNRSFLFTSQLAFIFPSLDSPRCSDLGSFLWPGCSTNETHGTTGVDATSVPRSFSAWLFFVLFLGCQVGIKYFKAKQFEGPTVNQVLKLMASQIRCQ